jgi:hypothetical protein
MTYKINGTELTLQPTSGRWLPRSELGITGRGNAMYSAVRDFEMRWVLKSPSELNQIQAFFNAVGQTGSVVVDLPQFAASTYVFYSYSGCSLREPEQGQFFTENIQDITLLITNIRV